jgi:hypothetical protein
MLFREQTNELGVLIALCHCDEDFPGLSPAVLRIDSDAERFYLRSNPSGSQSRQCNDIISRKCPTRDPSP